MARKKTTTDPTAADPAATPSQTLGCSRSGAGSDGGGARSAAAGPPVAVSTRRQTADEGRRFDAALHLFLTELVGQQLCSRAAERNE